MIDRTDWNSPYFDRSCWILSNSGQLSLTSQELLVVLVLDHLHKCRQPYLLETIAEKSHLSEDVVDECFQSLSDKGYLSIDTQGRRLEFHLEGLLDVNAPAAGDPLMQSLFSEFAAEFSRPLSPGEMEQILDLSSHFSRKMILRALDEAGIYEKRSVGYVQAVLNGWKAKGLSEEDIERGKR